MATKPVPMGKYLASAVSLLCMGLTGCDRAWQAYTRIELGKPLPEDHLLVREGRTVESVRGWGEAAILHLPVAVRSASVYAVLDGDGAVTAKAYDAHAGGHWLLFQSIAFRQVLEVQVPQDAFRDPPKDWKPPESSPGQPLTNVLEYALFTDKRTSFDCTQDVETDLLDSLSLSVWTPMALLAGFSAPAPSDLARVPEGLAGVTTSGYEWHGTNEWGGTYHVRNLGNRRVRFECKYLRMYDPLLLLGLVDLVRHKKQWQQGREHASITARRDHRGP